MAITKTYESVAFRPMDRMVQLLLLKARIWIPEAVYVYVSCLPPRPWVER